MRDLAALRWAATLACTVAAVGLIALGSFEWRAAAELDRRLQRDYALSELRQALLQRVHSESPRDLLKQLLARRDLGLRFVALRGPDGEVLASAGRYEGLRMAWLSPALRAQLREVLYALSSRYERIALDRSGLQVEVALGSPERRAVRDQAVTHLRRLALGALALGLLLVPALLWLLRGARREPSLVHRLNPAGGADVLMPAQRRAEDASHLRERMGAALDQLRRALLVVDRDARVLSLNASAERLTGWSATDAAGRPVYSIFHLLDDKGQPMITPAETALEQGSEFAPAEARLRARSGALIQIEVMAALLRDEHGVADGAILLFHDVSDRRGAEDALKREARLSQGVIDHLVEGVLTTDRAGIIRFANLRAQRMFGYTRESLQGASISRLMPVPFLNAPGIQLADYTGAQPGPRLPKVVGWRKDATTFPVDLTVEPLQLSGEEGLVVIVRDASDRLRGENLSLRLGRLLDNALEEVYIFDAQSLYFLEVNRGARRNLGYGHEQLARMTPLNLAPTLDVAVFHGYLSRLRGGELEHLSYRTEHKRVDGSTYPVEVRLNFSRDEEPPVFMAIATEMITRETGNVVPMPSARKR